MTEYTSPVDRAREALSQARARVNHLEREHIRALAERDRAEAHLLRVEEVDNHLRGAS